MKQLGRECRLSTLTPISAPLSLLINDNNNPLLGDASLLHGINAYGLPNQLIDLQSVSIFSLKNMFCESQNCHFAWRNVRHNTPSGRRECCIILLEFHQSNSAKEKMSNLFDLLLILLIHDCPTSVSLTNRRHKCVEKTFSHSREFHDDGFSLLWHCIFDIRFHRRKSRTRRTSSSFERTETPFFWHWWEVWSEVYLNCSFNPWFGSLDKISREHLLQWIPFLFIIIKIRCLLLFLIPCHQQQETQVQQQCQQRCRPWLFFKKSKQVQQLLPW